MKRPSRRPTPTVKIGPLAMGSRHPVRVQSMTDTATADVAATVKQMEELIRTGSELVRITINDEKAARAAADIVRTLRDRGFEAPVIGDFHFNGHVLLARYPQTAKLLDKYRINPGNLGRGRQFDANFAAIIRIARENNKPVRIGVNSGSLNEDVLAGLLDRNAKCRRPKDTREVIGEAMVASALNSAQTALRLGLLKQNIVLSVKMSGVQDTIRAYRHLARECDHVLHLGVTEAGSDTEGIVSSCAALSVLLQEGIGDTIRISLTPLPGTRRTREVEVCQTLLQALGLRAFAPQIISCPGCGRTRSRMFQSLARSVKTHVREHLEEWKRRFPGVEQLKIAVMGCVVNGPGESRHADIAVSLPGRTEKVAAMVYADGKKIATLTGQPLCKEFLKILDRYIANRFS